MTYLLLALVALLAYWWGHRVGRARAALRFRACGPDILVTICRDRAAPQVVRVARGDVLRMVGDGGTIYVGFAKTRPLPAEVGRMLEELGQ